MGCVFVLFDCVVLKPGAQMGLDLNITCSSDVLQPRGSDKHSETHSFGCQSMTCSSLEAQHAQTRLALCLCMIYFVGRAVFDSCVNNLLCYNN
jgi:hypothetical protein